MLQANTVTKPTLELLKTLMLDKAFSDFFLVGGMEIK